jgi:tetratricopeptide (TPR) repeat protein
MRPAKLLQSRLALTMAMMLAISAQGWSLPAPIAVDERQSALDLEQQGKCAEAAAAWQLFAKEHPSNAEPYAHLGLLEARQEHYKEAVVFYRKALALNPAMPNLSMNLGVALFKGGELEQAIIEFNALLKSEPSSSLEAQRLTILIGMAHYGLRQYVAASPYLKEAAARDPQNLTLRLALAHSCLWTKKYECVLDVYHEILNLNAESAEADMLAGEAMDELKNVAGAIDEFRAAVKAGPREPDVHFGLGYLLWTQKQFPEAASEFRAELGNEPAHAMALTYLADSLIHLNQSEAALPLIEKAIRSDPGIELAHLDLGTLLSDAGLRDDSIRELKIAEKLRPDDPNVHWHLGRLYQVTGKKEAAQAEFDKTRSLQQADDDTVFKMFHPSEEPPGAQAAK